MVLQGCNGKCRKCNVASKLRARTMRNDYSTHGGKFVEQSGQSGSIALPSSSRNPARGGSCSIEGKVKLESVFAKRLSKNRTISPFDPLFFYPRIFSVLVFNDFRHVDRKRFIRAGVYNICIFALLSHFASLCMKFKCPALHQCFLGKINTEIAYLYVCRESINLFTILLVFYIFINLYRHFYKRIFSG